MTLKGLCVHFLDFVFLHFFAVLEETGINRSLKDIVLRIIRYYKLTPRSCVEFSKFIASCCNPFAGLALKFTWRGECADFSFHVFSTPLAAAELRCKFPHFLCSGVIKIPSGQFYVPLNSLKIFWLSYLKLHPPSIWLSILPSFFVKCAYSFTHR